MAPARYRARGRAAGLLPLLALWLLGASHLRAFSAPGATWRGAVPVEAHMRTMELPERFIGKGYYLVELMHGATALTLLLDTGLTAPLLLTRATCEKLGLREAELSDSVVGSVGMPDMRAVVLEQVSLRANGSSLELGPLEGVVTEDFPQRKIGEEVNISLDGMLGMGFLEHCDVELDGPGATVRAWPRGELPAPEDRWCRLPALKLPADLLGLLFSVEGGLQPVLGIVDSGASHTVLNGRAAYVCNLEVTPVQDLPLNRTVRGIGLNGTAMMMPLVKAASPSLCGASHLQFDLRGQDLPPSHRSWSFRNTLCKSQERQGPMDSIQVGVGDISIFSIFDDDPRLGDFKGPAALIGQDVLSQVVLRVSSGRSSFWVPRP